VLKRVLQFAAAAMFLTMALVAYGPAVLAAGDEAVKQPGWHMWGPGTDWRKSWRPGEMSPRHRHRMHRHWTFMNGQIPARYQNLKNPMDGSDVNIMKGQKLYLDNCASCHGIEGLGEGEAGNDLFPSPALLAFIVQMPIAVDSYLMWTISEGGKDLNTGMPAFKDTMNDDEIWQVITYVRNGFAMP